MKNVKFDVNGYRYYWSVRGVDEEACVADIVGNAMTRLSDYTAAFFAEQYGCVAEVNSFKLMSHNQYQNYLQKNKHRLHLDKDYTLEDYRRDANMVEVLPFNLERYRLNDEIQAFIDSRFDSISYKDDGSAVIRGYIGSSVTANFIAEGLDCVSVCNQGFNGFYKNDSNRFILEFCEGDITLVICGSQKAYAAQLAEFNRYYEIEDGDVCLEVYFDNVHMDNIFVPQENVMMAISSLLQRGYEGYNPAVKTCWEELVEKTKVPNLSFRVVEAPTMVRDIDMVLSSAHERSNNSGRENGTLQEWVLD